MKNLDFNWKKFINGDVFVHTPAYSDYKSFMAACKEQGLKWTDGSDADENNVFLRLGDETVITCNFRGDGKITCGEMSDMYELMGMECYRWKSGEDHKTTEGFDWDSFAEGILHVNTPTLDDYTDFMKVLETKGYVWGHNRLPSKTRFWMEYKADTAISYDSKRHHLVYGEMAILEELKGIEYYTWSAAGGTATDSCCDNTDTDDFDIGFTDITDDCAPEDDGSSCEDDNPEATRMIAAMLVSSKDLFKYRLYRLADELEKPRHEVYNLGWSSVYHKISGMKTPVMNSHLVELLNTKQQDELAAACADLDNSISALTILFKGFSAARIFTENFGKEIA